MQLNSEFGSHGNVGVTKKLQPVVSRVFRWVESKFFATEQESS